MLTAFMNIPEVLDGAYLQVASELFHRKSAPNGIARFLH